MISKKGKMMRLELFFLILLLSSICNAYGIETKSDIPQAETTIPIDEQINASEMQSQISMVGADVSSVVFSLNWQNKGSYLEMTLKSPSGEQINQSAQAPTIYSKGELDTYYIVPNPEPGNWTAIIEAKKVPSKGEHYVFFASKVPGRAAITHNETESSDLSNTTTETNST
jgi:hypothetical protein